MADVREDREEISEVLVRYATGIDQKDWPLFRTCFTDDVKSDYGSIGGWSDLDGLTAFMVTAHEHMSITAHRMTNFVIDVRGDEASARSYVHAVLVMEDDPGQWFDAIGRYDDVFTRTSDGWRIAQRVFTMARFLTTTDTKV